jgi:hypothetical protein
MAKIATTDNACPQDAGWCWFHIILTAYGAWLYRDPRGFRTRHHREHVEGDYKNPPPHGKYADREARSRKLLKQEPVEWTPAWREIIGQAVIARLQQLGGIRTLCFRKPATPAFACQAAAPAIGRGW